MKVLIFAWLTIFSIITSIAHAGSGKAILPHWTSSGSSAQGFIYISNISDHNIVVEITFFNKDGNKYSPTTTSNFVSGNQLNPNSSGFVSLNTSSFDFGYAMIEWKNHTGDDVVALVAHGFRVAGVNGGQSIVSVPINNGQPF